MVVDISEHKKTVEALHESEEKYKALSDATLEAICISEKGICIEVNQTALEMFDYTYDEFIGTSVTDVITPESKEIVKQNIQSVYEEPYEVVALRKDGTKFLAEFEGKMFNFKGRNVRVTAVRDITVRKNAEKEIQAINHYLELQKLRFDNKFEFN